MTQLQVCTSVETFRSACNALREAGERVGFVPTMGALHAGHVALVDALRQRGLRVAVSLFVNPTQFSPGEDFARYPRTFERDVEVCRVAGVALLFAPEVSAMYPPNERTRVRVQGLSAGLCGPRRPEHFEGVATIVAKLFASAGPCVAIFGRKDYQQLQIIQRMARDLLLPVEVLGHPTVREADGLALSSRNAYLSASERQTAAALPAALSEAVRAFAAGERRAGSLREPVAAALSAAGFRVDYVELADPDELSAIDDASLVGERALLAVAAFLGSTRLIDNVVLGEDPAPIAGKV
jgi:pantoate--beta-alanine ligase